MIDNNQAKNGLRRYMSFATEVEEKERVTENMGIVLDSVLREKFIGGKRYFVSDDGRYKFAVIDKEILDDDKWTFYGWLDNVTTALGTRTVFKFGEAIRNTVSNRYKNDTAPVLPSEKMIVVWDVPVDKNVRGEDYRLVHKHAHCCCANTWEKATGVHGRESYFINTPSGVMNIIKYIDSCLGKSASFAERIERTDYDLVKKDVALVAERVKEGIKNFLCNFFMRYGKTGFALRNLRESDNRVAIVAYYIHTVAAGLQKEINFIKHNENICWVDTKWGDAGSVADEWLKKDPKHKVVIGLPLTSGSECDFIDEGTFARRVDSVKHIFKNNKSCLFIDEADYGADKIRQKKKIDELRKLTDFSMVVVMTGTNGFESAERIFAGERYESIIRTYVHITKSRPEIATALDWFIFMNDCLPEKIAEKFDTENWETIFDIDRTTGRFVGEEFIVSFLNVMFNPDKIVKGLDMNPRRVRAIQRRINPFGAYLIFGPSECEKMSLLKKLVEEVTHKQVIVLNGDNNVTCADAEEMAEHAIASVKSEGGRLSNIVFIADKMVFRSWSVKEVKNIIMMCNGGNCDTIAQKAGRALTPWVGVAGDTPEMARKRNRGVVFDYMFKNNTSSATNSVVQYCGRTSVLDNPSAPVDFFANFYYYCSDESSDFIRQLTQEEMEYMLCEDPETIRTTILRISKYLVNYLDITEKGKRMYFENLGCPDRFCEASLENTIRESIFKNRRAGENLSSYNNNVSRNTKTESEEKQDIRDGSDESIKMEVINWVYYNRGKFSCGDESYGSITDEFMALCDTPAGRAKYEDICERENRDFVMVRDVFKLISNMSCRF